MISKPHFRNFTTHSSETEQQPPPQQTVPEPILSTTPEPVTPPSLKLPFKRKFSRIIAIIIVLALVIALVYIWHSPASTTSPPVITQQNFSGTSPTNNNSTGSPLTTNGDIHVYVVGAIKHPGVYTLPSGARVYQLLQAAGGALPDANLVALNLAAQLSDGQEVYVLVNGEIPPTYIGGVPGPSGASSNANTGQLININTASADQIRQALHTSSITAQNIVNYRLQHGSYTSIDQLQQVVSKSIYDKIKNLVTI